VHEWVFYKNKERKKIAKHKDLLTEKTLSVA
jgi:hypothetical protein